MSKPNILWIMSDQHRYDCLSCNGHPLVKTPNMDRIAAEGVNYSNAYTPLPMCVPVRCSLLTGQWPCEHGVIYNFDGEGYKPLDPRGPSVPRVISSAGYHSHHFGRWHVSPQQTPHDFGFHEYTPDWRYAKWRKHRGISPCPHAHGAFGNVDIHATPETSSLGWHADQVMQFMNKNQDEEDPFFIRWHMVEPHLPSRPPEPFASTYKAEDIEPWSGWPDDLQGKPYMQKQIRVGRGTDAVEWEQWARTVGLYLGDIAHLDFQIGRVLDELDRLGIAEHTLVIYTADHGDMCGSHGMIDKHCIMYDDVVRVPLMMRWPEKIKAGTQNDDFVVNAIDGPATCIAAAGAAVPDFCSGVDLLQALEDGTGREDIFSTYHGNQFGNYSQRMVRDRRWKYVWNVSDLDELYDLNNDPGELHNLIRDGRHADELQRLRLRLVEWLEATHDTLNNNSLKQQLREGRIYDGT